MSLAEDGARQGDRIAVRGMRFSGRHGVSEAERATPQPIEVDVRLALDLRPAAAADDLGLTVNYSTVFGQVRDIVEGRSFRLIEALADAIATELLASHPRLQGVEVRVRKPRAPLPGEFETVEARLVRWRPLGS